MEKIKLFAFFILIYLSVHSNVYAELYTGAAYWGKTTANYVYPSQQGYGDPPSVLTAGTAEGVLAEYQDISPTGEVVYANGPYYLAVCRLALDSDGSCSSYIDYQWAIQRSIDCPPLTTPSSDYYSCVETVPNNPPVTPVVKMHGEDCGSIVSVGGN
ncbi:MAG: hypothetical protein OQK95_03140 [Gammaproteobacteria bacterium]|nr:hypothetical protein [Gammaproteobacteria bacterium]